jgi:hypothetical protein
MKVFSPVALGVVSSAATPRRQFVYRPDSVLGGITGSGSGDNGSLSFIPS